MDDLVELARAFYALFRGLNRAHGRYVPGTAEPGKKVEGAASTVRGPLNEKLWAAHLEGEYGLGVVPIMEDSTAVWGAIDVDVYDIDLVALNQLVQQLKLPLVTARTKSGGAHLFLFLTEPAPAELVRNKLMEWAIALGYAGVEIFPKQVKLLDHENDLGNWLNMPYYGGARSTRYALGAGGVALTPSEFLALARQQGVAPATLAAIDAVADERVTDLLADGPPCLQALAIHGFPQGTRNNALFNIAIYLRKRYGDDWTNYIHDYNEQFMHPALTNKEVTALKGSVNRKNYGFKCTDQPICDACSKQICQTRKYGIGGGDRDDPGVVFGEMVQILTEPDVSYIWDINGIRLFFPTARHVLDQRAFHLIAMDRIRVIPRFVNENIWRGIVADKLAKAEMVKPPPDATPTGQLLENLIIFLTQNARAREMDELLLGRPFTDEGSSYFRIMDFINYLRRQRGFGKVTEQDLYNFLRGQGGEAGRVRLKGREVRYWKLPAPETQTEPFTVPTEDRVDIDEPT